MSVRLTGPVVDVFRQCRGCGEWKRLAHFLVYDAHDKGRGSHKLCATCRRDGR